MNAKVTSKFERKQKNGPAGRKGKAKKRPIPFFRIGCWFCRLMVLILILILGAITYLTISGIPKPIIKHYLAEFNSRRQIGLAAERVRFYPPNVVWVSDVRVQGGKPDTYPLFECRDVWVMIDWQKFPEISKMPVEISVKGGNCNFRLHEDDGSAPTPKVLSFEDVVARAKRISEREWRLVSSSAKMGKASFHASGRYEGGAGESERDMNEWAHTGILTQYLEKQGKRERFLYLHKAYNDIAFPGDSEVKVDFNIDSQDKRKNDITVAARSERVVCRGVAMDDVSLDAYYRGQELNISPLILHYADRKSTLRLNYDLETKMVAFKGGGELPAKCIKALLPDIVEKRLATHQIDFSGQVESTFECGPVAASNVVENFSAQASVAQASVKDVDMTDFAVDLKRKGDLFEVDSFNARVGSGSLQGNGIVNIGAQTYSGTGIARIDPAKFLPLLKSEKLKSRIKALELDDSLVEFDGECSGIFGEMDRLYVSGQLKAQEFSYRGVAVDSFDSMFSITNKIVAFNDFRLIRPEGSANGSVSVDLNKDEVAVDAVSDCAPKAMAQIISTNPPPKLDPIDFKGPVHVEAKGIFDYGNMADSDLTATVAARDVLLKKVLFNESVFRSSFKGGVLKIYDLTGVLYDGTYNGKATFDIGLGEDRQTGYEVEMAISRMKFSELMERIKDEQKGDAEENVYTGRITADFGITGSYSNEVNRISSGSYEVAIREGKLFRIPLLGGLSHYLSKLFPGFGYLSQTELVSSGIFRPDRILLQETELQGTILSVKAHGDYYYDHKLDVDAQVVPMRKGIAASVMRIITFPVTKLFEFTLQGTLENPEWRPTNLPKQLFLKFD